jgi:hypothetical protein
MKLLAMSVLLVLPSFAALPRAQLAAVEQPEEYAVWSAVLTYAYPADASHQFLIEDRVPAVPERAPDPNRPFHTGWSALEVIDDASRQPYFLEKKFTVKLPYVLISREEEPEISLAPPDRISKEDAAKMQNDWNQFYKKYPGAYGIITLSRVGFLNHRTQAAVLLGNRGGFAATAFKLYFVTKKSGFWEVESVIRLFSGDGFELPKRSVPSNVR